MNNEKKIFFFTKDKGGKKWIHGNCSTLKEESKLWETSPCFFKKHNFLKLNLLLSQGFSLLLVSSKNFFRVKVKGKSITRHWNLYSKTWQVRSLDSRCTNLTKLLVKINMILKPQTNALD